MKTLCFFVCMIPFVCNAQIDWTISSTGFDASNYKAYDLEMDDTGYYYISSVKYDMNSGTFLPHLFKSKDGGLSWSEITTTGLWADLDFHLMISGHTLFAGISHEGIFKSIDGGATWMLCNGYDLTFMLDRMTVDGNGNFYATTISEETGTGVFYIHVFKSTDVGNNWSELNTTGVPVGKGYAAIAAYGNNLFLGVDDAIYKSTDGGLNWYPTGPGYNGTGLMDISIDDNGNIYVISIYYYTGSTGYNVEVYRSTTHGDDWTKLSNNGFPATTDANCISARGGHLFISLFNGIYAASNYSVLAVTDADVMKPNIYPNPASSYVMLPSSITHAMAQDFAGITTYELIPDATGRVNLSSLPQGVYLIQSYDAQGQLKSTDKLMVK